jgi:hypothetical protein
MSRHSCSLILRPRCIWTSLSARYVFPFSFVENNNLSVSLLPIAFSFTIYIFVCVVRIIMAGKCWAKDPNKFQRFGLGLNCFDEYQRRAAKWQPSVGSNLPIRVGVLDWHEHSFFRLILVINCSILWKKAQALKFHEPNVFFRKHDYYG